MLFPDADTTWSGWLSIGYFLRTTYTQCSDGSFHEDILELCIWVHFGAVCCVWNRTKIVQSGQCESTFCVSELNLTVLVLELTMWLSLSSLGCREEGS